MPIARTTIKKICQISRRTQRKYEILAKVRSQHNFAIGPQAKTANKQETAWQQGQALFHLTDHKGKQGKPGKTYLAWQLPNSYIGPHAQLSRGQQKRINQELADLFTQGITGNGKVLDACDKVGHSQRFYGNSRLAAKAYHQPDKQDVYWCSNQTHRSHHRLQLWHFLPSKS